MVFFNWFNEKFVYLIVEGSLGTCFTHFFFLNAQFHIFLLGILERVIRLHY